jgi:hypothetical protein
LELVSGYLKTVPLADILESAYRADTNLSLPPLSRHNLAMSKQGPLKNPDLEAKFEKVMNESCVVFFGKSLSQLESERKQSTSQQ